MRLLEADLTHFLSSRPARIAVAIAGTLIGIWMVLAIGLANVLRDNRPDLALAWAPWDARAKARAAELKMVPKADRASLADVRRLSLDALRRDPLAAVALRNIGMMESLDGREAEARRIFNLAGKLTKRDLGVHIWQIEDQVKRGDIPGALAHYDMALRTSVAARDLLMPILIRASDDPAIAEPLRRFLGRRPPWAPEFFAKLADQGTASTPILGLAQSWGGYVDRENWWVAQKLINRLYHDKQFGGAYAIFIRTVGLPPNRAPLVYNGRFATAPYFSPFDWQLLNDEASNASIDRADNSEALFSTIQTRHAQVATITLVLKPGYYVLMSEARSLDSSRTTGGRWLIRCEDQRTDELVSAPLSPRNLSGDMAAQALFQVPASGCRGQTLVLERLAPDNGDDPGLAVREVTIRPARSPH